MRHILPSPVRGVLTVIIYAANTLLWSSLIFLTAIFKFIFPAFFWRKLCDKALNGFAATWVKVNKLNQHLLGKLKVKVNGLEKVKSKDWSLVLSNHQSWVDILVLQNIFSGKIPFLKFFIKKELFWVPVLGQVWWALEFPFMKRYSRKFLEKYPNLKGKDLEITRKACKKFKHIPISIMNFVEGTRFSKTKKEIQDSPYKNLLKPRAGGIAHVISAMGGQLNHILDVTIVYPQGVKNSFWNFMCGRLNQISVHVKAIHISKDLVGDYMEDPQFRDYFQNWLNELWIEKDKHIDTLLLESREGSLKGDAI